MRIFFALMNNLLNCVLFKIVADKINAKTVHELMQLVGKKVSPTDS